MKKFTWLKKLVLYREHIDFSFGWFSFFVTLQTLIWFGLLYWPLKALQTGFWPAQLASVWLLVACFAAFHLANSFVEFFFHRYLLHTIFWQRLQGLALKHRKHHKLTHVKVLDTPTDELGRSPVRFLYPITEEHQVESSAFPGWALVAFWGVFTPVIALLQVSMPTLPWVTAGYLAVTWSFWLYEVRHAVEHLDYEKFWRPKIERSRTVRRIYGFHLMHHWSVNVNEAIGGFFGLPLPDLLFGTYHVPEALPLPGDYIAKNDLIAPAPCRFISWLDQLSSQAETNIKEKKKRDALRKSNRTPLA